MGQKVNPIGIRLGISRPWSSTWYADSKSFPALVESDYRIREMLRKRLKDAAVSHIDIERHRESTQIQIHTARPGTVIGKKGEDIERLRRDLAKLIDTQLHQVRVNIKEIKKPELYARLVAENIASQLERRVMFRRAMRRAVSTTMRLGAQGIKVKVSGRLNGAEIARSEWYREGRVPLHTLRADVDYGFREARTTYGRIGVKVWLYKGDILPYKTLSEDKASKEAAMAAGETSGPGARPRKIVSSSAARRREYSDETVDEEPAPLIGEADPEFEKLLDEEAAIEASTREHHETPHFRPGDD